MAAAALWFRLVFPVCASVPENIRGLSVGRALCRLVGLGGLSGFSFPIPLFTFSAELLVSELNNLFLSANPQPHFRIVYQSDYNIRELKNMVIGLMRFWSQSVH
jgi:hypothetical protein